ncbi:MAG: hypothetical protein KDA22_14530 [Phycisphaerales bacterium]|nr:hypothetical protein [Phycisphaerales bacterium]
MNAPKAPSRPLLVVLHLLGVAVGATAAVIGARTTEAWSGPLLTGGIVAAAMALATLPASVILLAIAANGTRRHDYRVEEQFRLLQQMNENIMLSDNAKRLIYRPKELQLLRSAIEEDIARGDYDAALTLCTEMAEGFGFREEAEAFRQSIEATRRESYEHQVREAMESLEQRLTDADWRGAYAEAARIRRLFPDSPVVEELDGRIAAAREERKRFLERQFLEAAQHEDVEAAMALLRKLDLYLTREEAAQLTEVAQGVVSKHRENLGVQFKLAVADRSWAEAVRVGDEIIRDFPNTKMAEEVRSMLDLLRTRASQAAVSAASPRG